MVLVFTPDILVFSHFLNFICNEKKKVLSFLILPFYLEGTIFCFIFKKNQNTIHSYRRVKKMLKKEKEQNMYI